jgi:hypothetical protein
MMTWQSDNKSRAHKESVREREKAAQRSSGEATDIDHKVKVAIHSAHSSIYSSRKMPELPEVENFRRMLLGLVSKKSTLTIECPSQTPPRTFLTPEQVKSLSGNCRARDVLRKGKLICMVLECVQKVENQDSTYHTVYILNNACFSTSEQNNVV